MVLWYLPKTDNLKFVNFPRYYIIISSHYLKFIVFFIYKTSYLIIRGVKGKNCDCEICLQIYFVERKQIK